MGFSVPLASWFRGPLKQRLHDAVLGEGLRETGIFDQRYLQRLYDQHQTGVRDNSASLWSLLMFESFQRQVLNGK
jgi:asparagine synthase (glutamine-hydrolysing)